MSFCLQPGSREREQIVQEVISSNLQIADFGSGDVSRSPAGIGAIPIDQVVDPALMILYPWSEVIYAEFSKELTVIRFLLPEVRVTTCLRITFPVEVIERGNIVIPAQSGTDTDEEELIKGGEKADKRSMQGQGSIVPIGGKIASLITIITEIGVPPAGQVMAPVDTAERNEDIGSGSNGIVFLLYTRDGIIGFTLFIIGKILPGILQQEVALTPDIIDD